MEVPDRFVWDLELHGDFSVSSIRKFLDSYLLIGSLIATTWNHLIPIKVNVFIWRIERDKFPTILNLRDKRIDLDSLFCPLCSYVRESTKHIFSSCSVLKSIWSMIANWWNVITPPNLTVASILSWVDELKIDHKSKLKFGAVIVVAFLCIWSFRNKIIFGKIKSRKDELFDNIHYFFYFLDFE